MDKEYHLHYYNLLRLLYFYSWYWYIYCLATRCVSNNWKQPTSPFTPFSPSRCSSSIFSAVSMHPSTKNTPLAFPPCSGISVWLYSAERKPIPSFIPLPHRVCWWPSPSPNPTHKPNPANSTPFSTDFSPFPLPPTPKILPFSPWPASSNSFIPRFHTWSHPPTPLGSFVSSSIGRCWNRRFPRGNRKSTKSRAVLTNKFVKRSAQHAAQFGSLSAESHRVHEGNRGSHGRFQLVETRDSTNGTQSRQFEANSPENRGNRGIDRSFPGFHGIFGVVALFEFLHQKRLDFWNSWNLVVLGHQTARFPPTTTNSRSSSTKSSTSSSTTNNNTNDNSVNNSVNNITNNNTNNSVNNNTINSLLGGRGGFVLTLGFVLLFEMLRSEPPKKQRISEPSKSNSMPLPAPLRRLRAALRRDPRGTHPLHDETPRMGLEFDGTPGGFFFRGTSQWIDETPQ